MQKKKKKKKKKKKTETETETRKLLQMCLFCKSICFHLVRSKWL